MTIGFFIDEYLPRLHGAVTSTLTFRRALEQLGHTVYVIAPSEPGYEDNDKYVIRLPSFDPKILKYKTRLALLYPGLAKKLARYKFDVVHSQTQFGMGLLAHVTAKALNVPHVSTMHTIFAEVAARYKPDSYSVAPLLSVLYPLYFRSMPKFDWQAGDAPAERVRLKEQAWRATNAFLNSADVAIAPSAHFAKALKQHGLEQTCYVLPNGVDAAGLQAQAKQALPKDIPAKGRGIWVVCVSRLSNEKRQRALVEAMALVQNPNVRLLLIGSGPIEDELRQLVAESGLADRVYVLGRREPGDIPAIVGRSDIFILPSYRFDNQPMVILEALALGLPVIYCDDNLTEGLTPKNAILTATPGPESLAKAIDQLAGSTKKRAVMARASRLLSQEFDIHTLAERLVAIYQRAIRKKAKTKA